MREQFDTKLIVREARPVHSGSRNGKPFTIYQLTATRADGRLIDNVQLRSFFDPPKNEVLEVHCELFRSERFGDSYTVTQKNRTQSRTQQLEFIKRRLDRIEQTLGLGPLEPEPETPASPPVARTPTDGPTEPFPPARPVPTPGLVGPGPPSNEPSGPS